MAHLAVIATTPFQNFTLLTDVHCKPQFFLGLTRFLVPAVLSMGNEK
jgi:hypothetical protein